MDQHQVGSQRHYNDREVLPEVSGGQEEQQEQVGAQVCAGDTELEGSSRQGQECHEGRGPQDDSQRADPELQMPLMNSTEKRQREPPVVNSMLCTWRGMINVTESC